jgi:hypothetical protein
METQQNRSSKAPSLIIKQMQLSLAALALISTNIRSSMGMAGTMTAHMVLHSNCSTEQQKR